MSEKNRILTDEEVSKVAGGSSYHKGTLTADELAELCSAIDKVNASDDVKNVVKITVNTSEGNFWFLERYFLELVGKDYDAWSGIYLLCLKLAEVEY